MMDVSVVYALPGEQKVYALQVEESCTVALAIKRSGILEAYSEITWPDVSVGIYSKKVALDALLQAGDRIEIYRPLLIDPKQARLLRAKKRK